MVDLDVTWPNMEIYGGNKLYTAESIPKFLHNKPAFHLFVTLLTQVFLLFVTTPPLSILYIIDRLGRQVHYWKITENIRLCMHFL